MKQFREVRPLPVVIAGDNDPHVQAVLSHLSLNQVTAIKINPARLAETDLTVSPSNLLIAGSSLFKATSVWYRRNPPLVLPDEMEEKWKRWCKQEFAQAFLGSLMRLPVHWVSNPYNILRASLKVLQLQVAREVELTVPDYVVTSNPEQAYQFIQRCHGKAVVKSLGRPIVGDDHTLATIFTNRVENVSKSEWQQLRYSPCIFQRLIDKVAEIRVTVVGDRLFSARIELTESIGDVDYRTLDPYTLKHEIIELPTFLSKACIELTKRLGLRFAALDFLLDAEDKFYFLEINPNGQWLWIEELTGLPIANAIAEELCTTSQ